MTGLSHQTFKRIIPCTGCGIRTMCVSKDGGSNFYCNRCAVAYGAFRQNYYDNPEDKFTQVETDIYSREKITRKEPVSEKEVLKEYNELVQKGESPKKARRVFNKVVEKDGRKENTKEKRT